MNREFLEKRVAELRKEAEHDALLKSIAGELFPEQLAFMQDPSRNKLALCTRRAGKTSMWARYTTIEAMKHPRVLIRIWANTRLRAKQMLWPEFKYLFGRFKLTPKLHETELTIHFDNDSEIRLLGADKDKEVQKKRGDKTWMEIVVESQLFGPYLRTLVEDVAEPCLFDLKGTFCLEGTPGPVCAGYWWEASGRNDHDRRWVSEGGKDSVGAGWSCHRWSVLDNPFVPHAKEELAALVEKRRWNATNPTFLREWKAQWVNDATGLFYKFNEKRNTFTLSEVQPWGPGWQHVLGWDLGSRDDMAIVVWGWNPNYPDIYEAFSWKRPGALSAEIVAQINRLEERGFNFIAKVADTGGGGRMFVEEVMSRYSVVFEAAKKTDKYEHVRLFNDDLLTGRIKLQRGSELATELAELPIDPEWAEETKDMKGTTIEPYEDPRFPNHCADAGLYAWRRAYHYLYTDPVHRAEFGGEQYFKEKEDRYVQQLIERGKPRPWWEPAPTDDDGGLEEFD